MGLGKGPRRVLALAALALLAPAGSAHAGTARMVALPEEPRDDGPAEFFDYAANSGESNRLEITGRPNGPSIVVTRPESSRGEAAAASRQAT